MELALAYRLAHGWPPLAWLAVCEPANSVITVYHGTGVETFDDMFCEAVWSGEFHERNLDQVETVCGSGGRVRTGRLTFVSSSSTVDRLQFLRLPGRVLVSNTLPGLLQMAGASLRPSYPYYNRLMSSIVDGLHRYRRTLPTSGGEVELVYHDNLVWNRRTLEVEAKTSDAPDFASFSQYVDYLERNLERMSNNAAAAERQRPRFRWLATVSSGYDSPTVATLAKRHGCEEALSFDTAASGKPDCGAEIAAILGLRPIAVSTNAWRERELPELPVFAGGHQGAVVFRGADQHLGHRILLTGFHGDKIWDLHNHETGPHLVRGDCSGLGLTEFRLWAGFLHCPMPFWAARKAARVHAISNSQEMEPWVVAGTDYNRPICRRIVEAAGVPREMFGMEKKFVDMNLWMDHHFMSNRSLADYLDWLRDNRADWFRNYRLPPWRSWHGDVVLNQVGATTVLAVRNAANRIARINRRLPGLRRFELQPLRRIAPRAFNLRCYVFPWSVDRAKQRYGEVGAC
jgi:hypothetical protein